MGSKAIRGEPDIFKPGTKPSWNSEVEGGGGEVHSYKLLYWRQAEKYLDLKNKLVTLLFQSYSHQTAPLTLVGLIGADFETQSNSSK